MGGGPAAWRRTERGQTLVDDDFLFAEDGTLKGAPAALPESRQPDGPPWRILIVDDDEEVHSVTRYALRKVRFRDRPLELLSAYSAAQALTMLAASAVPCRAMSNAVP